MPCPSNEFCKNLHLGTSCCGKTQQCCDEEVVEVSGEIVENSTIIFDATVEATTTDTTTVLSGI